MLPFSQHPRRHRSQILHDARLDRVDQPGSEVRRHLHQHRLVDQVPLGAVRHRVPAIVQMPDETFGADRGRKPAEEKPSRLERPPAAVQHRVKLIVVSREVQDGVDDDDVGEEIRERVCFDGFDAEVVSRQVRREASIACGSGSAPKTSYPSRSRYTMFRPVPQPASKIVIPFETLPRRS